MRSSRHTVSDGIAFRSLRATALFALVAVAVSATPVPPSSQAAREDPASCDHCADPQAIVQVGRARFTVLTPRLIRMEWAADGVFEDAGSIVFINRRLPVPPYEVSRQDGLVLIRTAALTLRYTPDAVADDRFAAANLSVEVIVGGVRRTWRPGMADEGNLLGTTRTLDGALGDRIREPMEAGLISTSGWAVVDDSKRPLFDSTDFRFDRGSESPWPWVKARTGGDRLDWYFFGHGHDYRGALGDFVKVAGRIPLPPRFAFGVWWSRYWAYSDGELRKLVRDFRTNSVPLDVLVVDMDWHQTFSNRDRTVLDQSGHRLGWSGYTWNRRLFPEPGRFLEDMRAEGLKVTLNLHPASGVQPWEDAYPAMARAMGVDPATYRYVPFDIANKRFATHYMKLLHHPLEREGIDFWWLDWQQEKTTSIEGLNPTWWLNYVHFSDQERQGKRPLIYHRWGGLGNHRYQIGFSGDTVAVWDSLAFQPWFTATAANVGYAYWSHDIGGFYKGRWDPELYLRWIQFGTFSPILRTHATKNLDNERERRIWAYPEPYAEHMRDAFNLRYALLPYLYTEARTTYDSGVAFLRPLYYDWPEEPAAYAQKGQYAFGDQLFVVPVTQAMHAGSRLARVEVWIPPGRWIEWPTGREFSGPQMVERHFSLEQIPVYARAGAILPMQPAMLRADERSLDPLLLTVFPLMDGGSSEYRLYEDNGNGTDYRRGASRWTPISAEQRGDELRIEVHPGQGTFPGMVERRSYQLRLPADWPPIVVEVNGETLPLVPRGTEPGWHYEGRTLTAHVNTRPFACTEGVVIRIKRPDGSMAQRAKLEGIAGAITRLQAANEALNDVFPRAYASDDLVEACQTPSRLDYHPETVRNEVARFPVIYQRALGFVQGLAETSKLPDGQLAQQLKLTDKTADVIKDEIGRYRAAVALALAHLQDGLPPSARPH